jgi:hypothetical protein
VAVPAADGSHTEKRKMTVSERSIPVLTAALQEWLSGRLAPARPTVSDVAMPDTGGLSSTSLLFEARLARRGRRPLRPLRRPDGARAECPAGFPRYDLPLQFEVISAVASCCDIPLPTLRWNEPGAVSSAPRSSSWTRSTAGFPWTTRPMYSRASCSRPRPGTARGCSGPAWRSWPRCTRSPRPPPGSRGCVHRTAWTRCGTISRSSTGPGGGSWRQSGLA